MHAASRGPRLLEAGHHPAHREGCRQQQLSPLMAASLGSGLPGQLTHKTNHAHLTLVGQDANRRTNPASLHLPACCTTAA